MEVTFDPSQVRLVELMNQSHWLLPISPLGWSLCVWTTWARSEVSPLVKDILQERKW